MAKQVIGLSSPGDGLGDPLRDGGTKLNANFTELYGAVIDVNTATYSVTSENKNIYHVSRTTTGTATITIASALLAIDNVSFFIVDGGLSAGTNNITIETEGAELIHGDSEGAEITVNGATYSFYTFGGDLFIKSAY